MAQINIPYDFELQRTLLANIITKNADVDAGNLIAAFLEEKQIDLKVDQQAGEDASTQDKLRMKQETVSQTAFKNRDNSFLPVFSFIRAVAQVLKKFYSTNTATLKDWGLPIADGGRISYPSSFEDRNTIATNLFAKLATFDDGKSPLAAYIKTNGADIAILTKNNTDAATSNTTAIAAAKSAENATEMRDLLWKTSMAHIRLIGNYLKSIYINNPRALGDWGFVVDESDRKPQLRKSKLKIGETKTVTGVAIGSIFTNTGKGTIIVYKGRDTTGINTILNAGDKMGMIAGYSIVTVANPSTLENAEFTIEINE